MNNEYTDIVMVVDRSGSMDSIREDAQGGINALIKEQSTKSGKCTLTLVQFDSTIDTVYNGVPIQDVKGYTLEPRGSTALLDAVGSAIDSTGKRLSAMNENDRPGLVLFVIVSDGLENASTKYRKDKIREMVEHQQNVYKWQFTYLGTNQDAFKEAKSIGLSLEGVANFDGSAVKCAYTNTSAKFARMRTASATGQAVSNAFTAEELSQMNGSGSFTSNTSSTNNRSI